MAPELFKAFSDKFISPTSDGVSELEYWRERVFLFIFFMAIALGSLIYAPSVIYLVYVGDLALAAMETVVYFAVVSLFFVPGITNKVKAVIMVALIYGVGVAVFVARGPLSAGPMWLFVFPMLAGVLLGKKQGLTALALNALTLGVFWYLAGQGVFEWPGVSQVAPFRLMIISVNFLFINAVALLLMVNIVHAITESNLKLRTTVQKLEAENAGRRQAEEELAATQGMLEAAIAQSPSGILIADAPDVTIRLANPAALGIRGGGQENLTGIDVARHSANWQVFRPDGTPFPPEELPLSRAVLHGEVVRDEEAIIRNQAGEDRWVNANAAPIYDSQDRVIAGVVVFHDITERKRAEEALVISQQKYAKAFMKSPVWVVLSSLEDGRYIEVNEKFLNLTGYREEEVIGQTALDLNTWADPAQRDEIIACIRSEKSVRNIEVQRLNRHGQRLDMLFSSELITIDQEECLLSVSLDVTEQKLAQETIRQSEARFRANFENAPVGIALIDTQRRFIDVNPHVCSILGYECEEMIGRSFNDFTHPDDRQGGRDRWKQLLAQGLGFNQAEKRYLHKDGHVIWGLVANTLIHDEGGEPQYFVSHFMDISEQKQAEQEKTELEAQLRQAQKMEALGTLAGGIAHDFNNILGAIMGFGELAQIEAEEHGGDTRNVDQIVRAAERARDLVKQLLAFSRRSETELRPVDLNLVVAQCVEMLKRTIPKMVDIEIKLDGGLEPIRADSTQLEQVIMNLAHNASDAMPDGGRLIFETAMAAVDRERAGQYLDMSPGQYVLLSVTDTGAGMDDETQRHIFDPFFTTKDIGKGTGLGLATVYGIVREHEGHIFAYSEPGQGTTLKVYFPPDQEPDSPAQPAADAPEFEAGGSETVLLVDDEQPIREMAQQFLQGAGYRVLTAANGEEALELYGAAGQTVDLVVLDLGMPGMGGHKCLAELVALSPDLKVLIASGYSAEGKVKDTLQQGAADYIAKPFRRSGLLQKVRSVLDA